MMPCETKIYVYENFFSDSNIYIGDLRINAK